MKKNTLRKAVTLLLVATSMALTACGGGGGTTSGPNNDKKVDVDKTQLYVGVYDGALGYQFALQYASEFEELYKDVSFETGKKGVQIFIDIDKAAMEGASLETTMPNVRQDVFFSADSQYNALVQKGVVGNITNVVTGLNYDANGEWVGFGKGTTTLQSRMEDHFKVHLNVGTEAEPQYYALPNFSSPAGIFYDVDLFKENGYFDGGNGPDGVAGTYDDGLPATWEDFKDLMDLMLLDNVIPYTVAGFSYWYTNKLTHAAWASYEGANDYMLNSTLSGTDNTLGPIDASNGYILQQQTGKLAALTAAYDMVSNPLYYSPSAFNNSQTHLVAQEEFVFSKATNSRIAMFIESAYWENEARPVFNEMGGDDGWGKREFSLLTFPRFIGTEGVPDQDNTKNTINLSGSRSYVFTNAYSQKKALADEFVGYCHGTSALRTYTRLTGNPRAFDYELTDADLAEMTPQGRNIWEIYHDPNTEKTYDDAVHPFRLQTNTFLTSYDFGSLRKEISTVALTDPLNNFYHYSKNYGLTPQKYFEGLQLACNQELWTTYYNRYLEMIG